jgi:outer membrane receptor protein involved in Fe transport
VNVITRKPGEGKRASLSIRGGEHGTSELACRATEKFGKLALGVSAGLQREDLVTVQGHNGRDLIFGRITGTYELGEGDSVLIESGILQGSGDGFMVRRFELKDVIHFTVRAQVDYQNFSFKTYYDRGVIESELNLQMYVPELKQTIARIPPLPSNLAKLGFFAQHFFELFHNRVTYGAEYFLDYYQTTVTIPDEIYNHRLGFYLQDEIGLGELLKDALALTFTGGLRFDYRVEHSGLTDIEVSPRASLVYNPTPDHGFRLGFARAFRKPTFMQSSARLKLDDLMGNEILTELNMSNPDLVNQTISSLELGYHGDLLDGLLQIRLDLAYNWYRDDILFEGDPSDMSYREILPGVFIPNISDPWFGYINEPDGYDGQNIELTLVARPTRHTRLFAIAGFRRIFKNATDSLSETEPVWSLAAGAELRDFENWSASLHTFFTSSHSRLVSDPRSVVYPFLDVKIPSTWLIRARLAYRIDIGPGTLTAGVEGFNLLGNRYPELGGVVMPNGTDFGAERHDRRLVFFLHGEL